MAFLYAPLWEQPKWFWESGTFCEATISASCWFCHSYAGKPAAEISSLMNCIRLKTTVSVRNKITFHFIRPIYTFIHIFSDFTLCILCVKIASEQVLLWRLVRYCFVRNFLFLRSVSVFREHFMHKIACLLAGTCWRSSRWQALQGINSWLKQLNLVRSWVPWKQLHKRERERRTDRPARNVQHSHSVSCRSGLLRSPCEHSWGASCKNIFKVPTTQ